eukprot:s653_g21.t1
MQTQEYDKTRVNVYVNETVVQAFNDKFVAEWRPSAFTFREAIPCSAVCDGEEFRCLGRDAFMSSFVTGSNLPHAVGMRYSVWIGLDSASVS